MMPCGGGHAHWRISCIPGQLEHLCVSWWVRDSNKRCLPILISMTEKPYGTRSVTTCQSLGCGGGQGKQIKQTLWCKFYKGNKGTKAKDSHWKTEARSTPPPREHQCWCACNGASARVQIGHKRTPPGQPSKNKVNITIPFQDTQPTWSNTASSNRSNPPASSVLLITLVKLPKLTQLQMTRILNEEPLPGNRS